MAISKVNYGSNVLMDLTGDTVDAAHLAEGYTAHNASGEPITGTMSATSGSDPFFVKVTQASNGTITADKTFAEIETAYNANKVMTCIVISPAYNNIPLELSLIMFKTSSKLVAFSNVAANGAHNPMHVTARALNDVWSLWYGTLVESVNGKSGEVTLTAADIGAVASSQGLKIVTASAAPTNADSNTITFVV